MGAIPFTFCYRILLIRGRAVWFSSARLRGLLESGVEQQAGAPAVTLNAASLLELEILHDGLRESLLAGLETRAALALRVAELQLGAALEA